MQVCIIMATLMYTSNLSLMHEMPMVNDDAISCHA